jgi:hypothetical protein
VKIKGLTFSEDLGTQNSRQIVRFSGRWSVGLGASVLLHSLYMSGMSHARDLVVFMGRNERKNRHGWLTKAFLGIGTFDWRLG